MFCVTVACQASSFTEKKLNNIRLFSQAMFRQRDAQIIVDDIQSAFLFCAAFSCISLFLADI